MTPSGANLDNLFKGYNALFQRGVSSAPSWWRRIATQVPSTTRENHYGWLGSMPKMREWLGERVINNLTQHSYSVVNRTFEATVAVPREDIEDDQYGVYGPMMEMMGANAAAHPDRLIFDLLKAGFATACYDGRPFFDASHPVKGPDDTVRMVSNTGGGSGAPWFLLDCSKPLRPLFFQERRPADLVRMDDPNDQNVFLKKEYIYGTDMRCNVGFGLWQFAYGSKAALDATSYGAARAALAAMRDDADKPIGVMPTHLVVGSALEGAGRVLIAAANNTDGASNIWAGTAELIVSPFLD
jgi:phage major head subunit gpT-like protein